MWIPPAIDRDKYPTQGRLFGALLDHAYNLFDVLPSRMQNACMNFRLLMHIATYYNVFSCYNHDLQ
jgi:hypothetical protein